MKQVLSAVALIALSSAVPQVNAGEFFVGVNAGTSNFSELSDACDELIERNSRTPRFPIGCRITEDSDTTLSVNAGYNLNRFLGFEVGYMDLGEYSADISVARISATTTASIDLAYAGIVLTAPFTDKFSVSARVGGVSADIELSALSASLDVDDETTAFVGASIDYRLTDNISVQVRYDDMDVIDVTSAGIRYHF